MEKKTTVNLQVLKNGLKRILWAAVLGSVLLVGLWVLFGCSNEAEPTESTSPTTEETSTDTAASTAAETAATSSDRTTIQSDASVMDLYDWSFSDRDMDASYDEAGATKIVLSDSGTTIDGSGAEADGSVITISQDGVYVISGTLSDGSITVDLPGDSDKAQLVLNGVDITCSDGATILVESADKVFITLADGSENRLEDGSTHEVAADENDHDGVVFSHDDLTLNGSGTLMVTGNYDNGIVGKDDVRITGGTYIIETLGHGIQAKDALKVLDGDFTITCGADAFHSSNDEDETLGYLGIGGGTYTIAAGDDAFHAESALLIADGTIDITQSYEGFEGKTVSVTGGTHSIAASDDGLNAATSSELSDDQGFMGPGMQDGGQGAPGDPAQATTASSDCFLEITGGNLYVKAGGDGLDSNGNLTVSGGDVVIESTSGGQDSAIDCDGTASISAGTLVAIGPSGMAEGFDAASSQASIMLNGQVSAGTALTILDSAGNEIYSFTPTISTNSIVFSSNDLIEGESYTVTSNGQNVGTATASLSTQGMGMGGVPGGQGGMGDQGGMGGQGAPRN